MSDIWKHFLAAELAERLDLAADPGLVPYLGADALAEYRRLAAGIDGGHLGGDQPVNLIFLPGVMGSSLNSDGLGGIWWLDLLHRKHIGDLRLSASGASDHDPQARVVPVGVMPQYEGFLAATYKQGFTHRALPYDWRKSITASAATVRDAVEAADRPVHIVAHSMGGLVARTALMIYPDLWERIGRIVFLGTPHYGSPAIAGYLKNHLWGFELLALLGRHLDRAAFRSLRGVLDLLPAPADVYPGTAGGEHPCASFDLYDVDAWHLGLTGADRAQLQSSLDSTARLHRDLSMWHGKLEPEQRDRMACIVGVGKRTLFRLAYRPIFGTQWRHMDRVTGRETGTPHREGDGRVPVASALLPGVTARFVEGEHGELPGIPAVYRDVFRYLRGEPMQLATTAASALDRSHLASAEDSQTPVLSSFGAAPVGDDPGYLRLDDVDPVRLDTLDAEADSGRLPEFGRIRIL